MRRALLALCLLSSQALAGSVSTVNPNPPRPATAIATLPTCGAAQEGVQFVVTNGIASPTYGQAVSTTGTTHHLVTCLGGAWVYE